MSLPQRTQCRGPSDGRGPCCHAQPLPWGITPPSDPHIWLGGKRRAVISRQGQGIHLSYKGCWAESSLIQLLPTPQDPAALLPFCLGMPALPRRCIPFLSGSSLIKQQEQSCAVCSSASASTGTREDVFHRCLWFQKGNATSPGKIP